MEINIDLYYSPSVYILCNYLFFKKGNVFHSWECFKQNENKLSVDFFLKLNQSTGLLRIVLSDQNSLIFDLSQQMTHLSKHVWCYRNDRPDSRVDTEEDEPKQHASPDSQVTEL